MVCGDRIDRRKASDEGLEFVDAARQVVWGVEFVSPGELGAFDAAVEVGTFWRQDHELEAVFLAMILEDGHELGSAVDLDAFDPRTERRR